MSFTSLFKRHYILFLCGNNLPNFSM